MEQSAIVAPLKVIVAAWTWPTPSSKLTVRQRRANMICKRTVRFHGKRDKGIARPVPATRYRVAFHANLSLRHNCIMAAFLSFIPIA